MQRRLSPRADRWRPGCGRRVRRSGRPTGRGRHRVDPEWKRRHSPPGSRLVNTVRPPNRCAPSEAGQDGRKAKSGPEPARFRGACAYDNPLFFSRLYGSQAGVPGPFSAFRSSGGRTALRGRMRPPERHAEAVPKIRQGTAKNPVKYFLQRARAQRCGACRRRTRWAPPRSGTAGWPPAGSVKRQLLWPPGDNYSGRFRSTWIAINSSARGHRPGRSRGRALNSPWWNPRVAPRAVRRPADKA